MFQLFTKDKYNPIISKNNLFSSIYIPTILYVLHLSENLYKFGQYENAKILFLLIVLELAKYYFLKTGSNNSNLYFEKKLKLAKLCKSAFFLIYMIFIFYIISVLLGAPFLSEFEQTFMFSCLLTVLSTFPLIIYLQIDDIFHLLDVIYQPKKCILDNMIVMQFELTLLGAWLGTIPIPLDWDREWQIWPNSCVLGAFSGYFTANILFYLIQLVDYIYKNRKNHKYKDML